jgi:RsiW-degrading membrane proteinase PrsW (M82 family)
MNLIDFGPTAIVAAAIAPGLLLLWLVVAADSRPEPPSLVWTAFILGALSIFALHYILAFVQPHLVLSHDPWLALDEKALFLVGIPEESLKIFIIAVIAFRARAFDEPMDGVVYGAAVGLGFAANENLGYLTHAHDWQTLAVVRGILTVPFHAALGAIAGAYIASARFGGALGAHRRGHWVYARLIVSAWLIPVVLHTLYDIPLLALRKNLDDGGVLRGVLQAAGLVVGFGTIAIAVRLALRLAGHQKANSRTPLAAWRNIWGWLVVGAGVGFAGAALMVSTVRHWEPASGPFMVGVGGALVALAIVIFGWSRKYLFDATMASRH